MIVLYPDHLLALSFVTFAFYSTILVHFLIDDSEVSLV